MVNDNVESKDPAVQKNVKVGREAAYGQSDEAGKVADRLEKYRAMSAGGQVVADREEEAKMKRREQVGVKKTWEVES